jgi:hypothetical protein
VLELDSSTPDKFSRHLLVRIPGAALPNNKVAGHLVGALISSAEAQHKLAVHQPPPRGAAAAAAVSGLAAQQGVVVAGAAKGGGGGAVLGQQGRPRDPPCDQQRPLGCFVDSAVYSRNRHFRMLGSSKGGKAAVLWPTARYALSAAGQ